MATAQTGIESAQSRTPAARELGPFGLAAALIFSALGFAVLAYGGVSLTKGSGFFAAVWIPNALSVAALLRFKPSREGAFIIALFIGSVAGNYFAGIGHIAGLGFSTANCAEIFVTLHILRRTGDGKLDMENMADLLRFVVVAAGVAPLLSAAIASGTLLLIGVESLRPMLDWYLADALGMLIVAPTALLIIDYLRGDLEPVERPRAEWVGLTVGGFLVTAGVFSQSQSPLLFLIAPIMVIMAFRLGSLGATVAFIQISFTATFFTAFGQGPVTLHAGSIDAQLLVLEAFLATGFAIGLPVAAAVAQERRAILQLIVQEEQLAVLANNMSDAVMRYGIDGVCTYASHQVADVLGQPPDHFVGKGAAEDVHPEAREQILRVQERLVSGLLDKERLTYRRVIDDETGRPVYIEADCVVARNAVTTAPEAIIVSCRDVSERVRLEKSLVRARRHAENAAVAKSQFLANMSHEIRTPMNGVLGFVELLLQSDLKGDQRRHAELIQESGNSMMHLLNDILDISKIEAGQIAVTQEPLDLKRVISNCLALHSAQAEQKGLKLVERIDAQVPSHIVSDSLRLRQIVVNLLANAVKFTAKGAVTLSTHIEENDLVIAVKDQGIGIEPDRLEAIFHPFEQADNATSRKFGGTGLGLSISRRLAELLGGTLAAQSTPGKGARFELRLPVVIPDNAALDSPARQDEGITQHSLIPGARILLAEDHDINRILVTAMLERCGQAVEIAEDGQKAVAAVMAAKAGGAPFDLVLMDIQMPECDGYTATETLRSLGIDANELPIIALTANAFEDDLRAAEDAGMQGHLAKPLKFDSLLGMLEQWLPTVPATNGIRTIGGLTQECAGNASLEERWQQRRREALEAVAQALRDGSLEGASGEELARIVHKLAGTAGMFGENGLGEKASALERGLKSDQPYDARARLAQDLLDAA